MPNYNGKDECLTYSYCVVVDMYGCLRGGGQLVDKELSGSALADRGRRRWWQESLRPHWRHQSLGQRKNALAWAALVSATPVEVLLHPSICEPAGMGTSASGGGQVPRGGWCVAPRPQPAGVAATVTVTMSCSGALCYDTLVLRVCGGWWGKISRRDRWTSNGCAVNTIAIADIVEVRRGIDSYLFRRMVDLEMLDPAKSVAVCAALFTTRNSYYIEFSTERSRDEFICSVRSLQGILLTY